MQEFITAAVATGVYVITVRSGEKINGMTAAWVTQVSFAPQLIAASIAPSRYTHELIEKSGYFCLNALPDGAFDVARHFGFKSGRKTDKFTGIAYRNAMKGSPILESAYAFIECEVVSTIAAGDHNLFIGNVVDSALLKKDATPFLFRWQDFFGKRSA